MSIQIEDMEAFVIQWAKDVGIIASANRLKQSHKTLEEVGELIEAVALNERDAIIDAIGDITVTIIIQAYLNQTSLKECLEAAYNVIKKRTGKMVDGQFVKDE